MRVIRLVSPAIALGVAATAMMAQSPMPALDRVAAAMGGKDRILAVRTLVLEGAGESLNFGQNHTPFAETKFEVTAFKVSLDFANRRWLVDQTRVPKFRAANTAPQRQRFGLDGAPSGVAYNIGNNDNMTRASAQVAADRAFEFLYHPIGFVMAAYRSDAATVEEAGPGNTRRIRITPQGQRFAMIVDARTNLPTRIERVMDQPMLGDVTQITELSDWRDVTGVKVPMRMTAKYETLFTVTDYRFTSGRVDADVGNIAATDSIRNVVAQAGQPAAPAIAVDTIAPGVWSIAGQSHHTIAIEQSNKIVLVEAPQNDARSLAAIAKARELNPAKPLETLINTHHHFDHSGGLRAAMSQGLTIMTHQANKDFYERIVHARPHSLRSDALSANPKPLKLVSISDKHVMRDSLRTIEVHPLVGNDHSGSMLIVYLPAERVLIQADLYNPPAANAVNPVFPFAANLVENVRRLGLQVDRVVGIHGRPVPFSEVQAAASAPR